MLAPLAPAATFAVTRSTIAACRWVVEARRIQSGLRTGLAQAVGTGSGAGAAGRRLQDPLCHAGRIARRVPEGKVRASLPFALQRGLPRRRCVKASLRSQAGTRSCVRVPGLDTLGRRRVQSGSGGATMDAGNPAHTFTGGDDRVHCGLLPPPDPLGTPITSAATDPDRPGACAPH